MGQQIECRIIVKEEIVWSTPLAANYVRSLNRVSTEEDRLHLVASRQLSRSNNNRGFGTHEVQSYDIIIPLTGVELDSEASRISSCVWEFSAKCHRRISKENGRFDAFASEKMCLSGNE